METTLLESSLNVRNRTQEFDFRQYLGVGGVCNNILPKYELKFSIKNQKKLSLIKTFNQLLNYLVRERYLGYSESPSDVPTSFLDTFP